MRYKNQTLLTAQPFQWPVLTSQTDKSRQGTCGLSKCAECKARGSNLSLCLNLLMQSSCKWASFNLQILLHQLFLLRNSFLFLWFVLPRDCRYPTTIWECRLQFPMAWYQELRLGMEGPSPLFLIQCQCMWPQSSWEGNLLLSLPCLICIHL